MARGHKPKDRATDYADQVLAGKIIAGPYVRAACQRHLNDLEHGEERGLYYDPFDAQEAIGFIERILHLNGGQYEGKPFLLFPWQSFIISNLFGWMVIPKNCTRKKRPIKTKEDKQDNPYMWVNNETKEEVRPLRRFHVVYVETGKGPLALDTPIFTPNGWSTMGQLNIGDYVFDAHGKPTLVVGVSPIFYGHNCYELSFSDGDKIIADAQHEWIVTSLRNGHNFGPHNLPKKGEPEKRNTEYISQTYAMPKSQSKHPQAKWNHRIDVAPPLSLPDIKLPIAPFTLGAWLGDGDSSFPCITIHKDDLEIIDNIALDGEGITERKERKPNIERFSIVNGHGYKIVERKVISKAIEIGNFTLHEMAELTGSSADSISAFIQKCDYFRMVSPCINNGFGNGTIASKWKMIHSKKGEAEDYLISSKSMLSRLHELNLIKNKHIPKIYFRAGTKQRLALLQGIMDTDGHVAEKGHCEITLCNKQLTEDVAELLRTLGYKCRIHESAAKLNGIEVGRRWRISFQAYKSQPPVRLKRKLGNLADEPKTRALSQGQMIVGCEPVESVPVRCITVASDDHMFLAGKHLVPTCNSGKSPTASAVGMKGLVADKESRAEVYAAATTQSQAMVLFRDAVAFFDQSPELQSRLIASGTGEKRWNLAYLEKGSFFRAISSEKKQAGPRPSVVLLDEIHEHPDNTVIEMLRAGFKFRRNPISFMITNAGHDKTSVCWEYHDMGVKIACEQLQNDEFFAFICALDDDDMVDDKYLEDETVWPKVNPSLPYGLPGRDYIRQQVREAHGMPSKMSTVKRLNFCVWTEAENPWIGSEVWNPCRDAEFDVQRLIGRRCWGGLDLSAVNDLTSFGLIFEPSADDPLWRLKVWFWIPDENLRTKVEVDRVPYDIWKQQGHLFTSNGAAISKAQVIQFIANEVEKYQLVGIAYDRHRIKDLLEFAEKDGIDLAIGKWDKDKRVWNFDKPSGIKMMPFGQEARSMAPAIDKFETMMLQKQFRHDGNPCLTWNASNVVVDADDSGYRKMSKRKSTGRIDGIFAAVMAVGIIDDTPGKSVFEDMSLEDMKARMAF